MKKQTFFVLMVIASVLLITNCSKKTFVEPNTADAHNSKLKTFAANGALDDTNIKYFGRWDFSNTAQYVSNWGGAYIRVNFTGTTVKVKVGNTNDYFVKIDNGPWVSYLNVSGTVNLTPTPLSSGTHSLIVAQGKDYAYEFKFEGLVLDAGATTSAPTPLNYLIEYIGDSITAGFKDAQANVSAYGWVCAEGLNAEHTQIAWPGIKLISGSSYKAMDYQYLKLKGNYNDPSTTANWDFSKYTPQIVVVNLGTNDNPAETSNAAFQTAYTSFLATIRSKFPNAEIFAMRTYVGVWETPTQAAVNARIAAGDNKVHFVNTTGWLTANTSDYLPGDNTHPSVSGQAKAGNLLKSIIAPYVGGVSGNPPVGQIITLKSSTNQYVSSESGAQAMNANRASAGVWEQFGIVSAGSGKVALQNSGKYVSCENGAVPINCNRTAVGAWEQFTWVNNNDGTISLLGSNGKYVSSEGGLLPMTCTRASIGVWEKFRVNQ